MTSWCPARFDTLDEEFFERSRNPPYARCATRPDGTLCGHGMRFMSQVDSVESVDRGWAWFWISGGMLYVFWCDDCSVSGTGVERT